MTRAEAVAIVDEYVKNPNLKKHMLAVEAAMSAYAEKLGGDVEEWGIVGLLHDFDYEIHPSLDEHPALGQTILETRGVPPHIRRAVLTHAKHTGVQPQTPMEKAIFAVDELAGFIVAVALVMPNRKLAEVMEDSVMKKLQTKSFAAKVSREEIYEGAAVLGAPLKEHVRTVLKGLQTAAPALGL
jgi:putative nucleotidyltransferase with HDIG domain